MKYAYDLLILAIQMVMFYIFPMVGEPTDMGVVVIIIASTFILPMIVGVVSKSNFKYYYPAIVSLLYIPSVILYYNYNALIYSVLFIITGYIGLFIGIGFKMLITKTKAFRGLMEISSALFVSLLVMMIVMLMLLDAPIKLSAIYDGNIYIKLAVVVLLGLPIAIFLYLINLINQRNTESKLRQNYLKEIKDKDRILHDKDLKISFLENKIEEINNKSRKLKLDNQTIQGRIDKLGKEDINSILENESDKLREENVLLRAEIDKLTKSIRELEKAQEN